MPIRYESVVSNKICYGTPDGQILGELDSVSTIELSAEAEQYVTDVPAFSQMEFSGSFKIVSNNERKMHGKPLMRGGLGIRALLKRIRKSKRRDRGRWFLSDDYLGKDRWIAVCSKCGFRLPWSCREKNCPCCGKRMKM